MSDQKQSVSGWTSTHVYTLAITCLLVGIAAGYFVRGSAAPSPVVAPTSAATQPAPAPAQQPVQQQTPSVAQLKQMADQQAAPVLAQLKKHPGNAALWEKAGNFYYDARQFKQAVEYYQHSLQLAPNNPNARTDLGTAYAYLGDADHAISEFKTVLKYDPKHTQAMYNLGLVEWRIKGDARAAIADWKKLLSVVPNYQNRAMVEQLISEASQHTKYNTATK